MNGNSFFSCPLQNSKSIQVIFPSKRVLKWPNWLRLERCVMQAKIDSEVRLFLLIWQLLVKDTARNWFYESSIFFRNHPCLFCSISKLILIYFYAHLIHYGESSLSPNPPNSSEKIRSGCSGILYYLISVYTISTNLLHLFLWILLFSDCKG